MTACKLAYIPIQMLHAHFMVDAHVWSAMDSNDRLLFVGLDLVDSDGRNLLPNTYLELL